MTDELNITDSVTLPDAYPTAPDAEGFFIESEDDGELGIKTKTYDNGNKIKQTILPKSGKTAQVRELTAKESKDIQRFMGGDKDKYTTAAITIATLVDGEKQPFEWFEALKMKDYSKLLSMFSDLNF